jgi:hypothetical protein
MKTPAFIIALLLTAVPVFATPQVIKIEASYKGLDRSFLLQWLGRGQKMLHTPVVTVKSGQQAPIVMVSRIPVQTSGTKQKIIDTGITLDVTPTLKNGKIDVYGSSTFCRAIEQKNPQPLSGKSFLTRQTYFHGEAESGKPITIETGDKHSGKGQITLIFTLHPLDGSPL